MREGGAVLKKGFTLAEIIIVLIILGILAALVGPKFSQSINRARARDAINSLIVIHGAQQVYRARNGSYLNGNLSAINNGTTGLGLNITNCSSCTCAGGVTCTASGTGFSATATLASSLGSANPSCSGNACP